jgi:hypothetical protein
MLLAVLSLMYIIMALNIVMFSLVPDYTMFGNQHFQRNVTGKYFQSLSVTPRQCFPNTALFLL